MNIPDFQSLTLPVLRLAAEGETKVGDAVERLSRDLGLSDEERSHLLPSGRQTTFANRVHWAKSYLGKAGLIHLTRRGHFAISDLGRKALTQPPARMDIRYLSQFPDFQSFRVKGPLDAEGESGKGPQPEEREATPDEVMRQVRDQVEEQLGSELIQRIMSSPPAFFEKLVIQLLTAMGYGGSVESAGRALGRSGDGGVDGVIDEDALGLDRIYVQAKRYAATNRVGASEVRDFFGALDQFKAGKGLFVTTSSFTEAAQKTAAGLSRRIVLVDGVLLARLMIRYDVGCRTEETFVLKKVDEEFFEV